MSTIEERVARGVEWLDCRIPDWWQTHTFNLDRFALADGCRCVVGQLAPAGDYGEAILWRWFDLTDDLAFHLGFYAGEPGESDGIDADYRALEAEWRRVITARRAAPA